MYAVLFASALFAVRALAGPGEAVIYNGCSYPVYLLNTPSNDGNPAHQQVSKTLQPGDYYNQTYVKLDNLAGWALKLSKDGLDWNDNIMQYEYTYQANNEIWYDLSGVNGNPWNGNWLLSAWGGSDPNSGAPCAPTQQYYRCPTDNGYGMQSACTESTTVEAYLCAAESKDKAIISSMISLSSSAAAASSTIAAPCSYSSVPNLFSALAEATGGAGSVVSSVVAQVTNKVAGAVAPAVSTSSTSTPTPTPSPSPAHSSSSSSQQAPPPAVSSSTSAAGGQQKPAVAPTTFVTSKTAQLMDTNDHVVTEVVTFVTTAEATHTVWARHEHHPHHEH